MANVYIAVLNQFGMHIPNLIFHFLFPSYKPRANDIYIYIFLLDNQPENLCNEQTDKSNEVIVYWVGYSINYTNSLIES